MSEQNNKSPKQAGLVDSLTERELEILHLLADGWTDRKIAHHLILALDTVKWYNKRIYSKLAVKNRTEAVKRATELSILESSTTQASASTTRHNLPATTTPFVGRELELDNLADIIANDSIRLVTILAAGGMGKTRLALEVAKSQLPNFNNGVYFIPLVQLRDVDNIIPTIATYLDIQLFDSGNPIDDLIDYIYNKDILFVLDNFEHLLDGANLITKLLEKASKVKVLVTSRERLNLRGETVYALGGMALPTNQSKPEILNSSAVQLFIQRMQAMRLNATVPGDEIRYIIQICRQVWGMPLGIELAASLVEILSLEEIAIEIEHNYDILSTEMRDMPRRLRSIRAVFDYSWSQLTEAERDVYMRLAVFRDGFTREAAQVIAETTSKTLLTLVNKSLLQRESDSGHFVIHELLRQYAEEQLHISGDAHTTHHKHMIYYSDMMAQCEHGIKGHQQLDALNQIASEFENIRASWQWAVEHSAFDAIDQSLEALYWFCNMRASIPAGRLLFQQAQDALLSFDPDEHPAQRRLLLRFDASEPSYKADIERMLALVREQDTQTEVAFFLWMLGVSCYVSRDFNRAITILEEAINLYQTLGDDLYRIESLHLLGICNRFLGKVKDAQHIEKQLLDLCRNAGNKFALGRALGSQGLILVYEDNTVQAKQYLEEAIVIRGALGDTAGVAISLASLGFDSFFHGNLSQARAYAEDGLKLATEINHHQSQAFALSLLSWIGSVEESYYDARKLALDSLSVAPDPSATFGGMLGATIASCGLGNDAVTRENLRSVLEFHSPFHTPRSLAACLLVLGILYTNQGEADKAVEVLALAYTHPMSPTAWMEKWMLIKRLQTELQTTLGVEQYASLWQRGKELELNTVLNNWLEDQSQAFD